MAMTIFHLEVDFLIGDSNEPLLLVETTLSEKEPARALMKFQDSLNVPAVQLIESGRSFRMRTNGSNAILISPAPSWLARLP